MLWQTANRIQADQIDIDRDKKILVAAGNVVSEFIDQDKSKPATPGPPRRPRLLPPKAACQNVAVIPVAAKPAADGDRLKGIRIVARPSADSAQSSRAQPADKPVVYTVVNATKMVYTDETRLADYTGGVS